MEVNVEENPIVTDEQLADLANSPQSMTVDGQTVSERSAADIIALDKYAKARRAATATPADPFAGLRFGVISPPGTTGRQ